MIWEFWRRSRLWICSIILGGALITVTVNWIGFAPLEDDFLAHLNYMAILFGFIGFTSLTFSAQYNKSDPDRIGFPKLLYIKPLASWQLALWQTAIPLATVSLLYLYIAGLAYAVLGAVWPLLGPTMFLGGFLVTMQAINWAMVSYKLLRVLVCMLIGGLCWLWLYCRYGLLKEFPDGAVSMWSGPTLGEFILMLTWTVSAYGLAVAGIASDRRGDSVGLEKLGYWFGKMEESMPGRMKSFRTEKSAQLWFLWRKTGWILPTLTGICIIMIITANIAGASADQIINLLFCFGLLSLFSLFFIGMVCANCNKKGALSPSLAALPVSDKKLTLTIFQSALLSIALSLIIVAAGIIILTMLPDGREIIGKFNKTIVEVQGKVNGRLGLAVIIFAAFQWALLGLGASMSLYRRKWLTITFISGCYCLPLLSFLIIKYKLLPPGFRAVLFDGLPWLIGLLCLGGAALGYRSAISKSIFSKRIIWPALSGWLGLCAITACIAWDPAGLPGNFIADLGNRPDLLILAIGLLALPITPFALAPLALWYNRHR